MKDTSIVLRIDSELKESFAKYCKDKGVTVTKELINCIKNLIEVKANVYTNDSLDKKKPVKDKNVYTNNSEVVPTKETTLKGELKRTQKPKGIYSTERRSSAKDSLNRINIDF